MIDYYGRNIDYLRLSITDRCNLRCQYCMPKEGIDCVPMADILTYEEILEVVKQAVHLGIRIIKITGGEPLVRKDCCDLIRGIKSISGIEKVTLTTNGVLLRRYLPQLIEAGIDGINISIDTINKKQYTVLTHVDALDEVMAGLKEATSYDIPIKVNAVSLKGLDYKDLIELARNRNVDIRFIEMMPIGLGKMFESYNHEELIKNIQSDYPNMIKDYRHHGYGPAVYYQIPGFQGSIGFISAIHGKFCSSCNRVRLTSQGFLKTCLCYDDGCDLRELLRQHKDIQDLMRETIFRKPKAHCFENEEHITELKGMSMIGG